MATPLTLFDKIWQSHVIAPQGEGTYLIYIDMHLVHEVTSPQAFEGLRLAGRRVHRPDATIAVPDHNVPTTDRSRGIDNPESRLQLETLERNVREFGVPYFPIDDIRQGIVHIIGPEQGLTQPGMTIVCGDSHTATHGAFGALAFGIGTSEVEHVLATQTLIQQPAENMRVEVEGTLPVEVTYGPDLARPLHALWPALEEHAARIDRLCCQQAGVRFEVVEDDLGPGLVMTIPLATPGDAVRVLIRTKEVRIYVVQGGEVYEVDHADACLDRSVYLLLAELAARS